MLKNSDVLPFLDDVTHEILCDSRQRGIRSHEHTMVKFQGVLVRMIAAEFMNVSGNSDIYSPL